MEKVFNYEGYLAEARYKYSITDKTRELHEAFSETPSGRDLRAFGVEEIIDLNKIRLERRRVGQSMPRTGVYKDPSDGKFYVEHYSGKPGLAIYGKKSFDDPEDLYRYLWVKIAKNAIPASLMSKRDVEKKIDFDELFPPGSGLSQDAFLDSLKPLLGGEELAHPSNQELMDMDEIQKLIDLGLIGRVRNYSTGKERPSRVVEDISKNAQIKYFFYCRAAQSARNMYKSLIEKIFDPYTIQRCLGSFTKSYEKDESWTVTNTNRIPKNSANFRTGERTLRCHIQENSMVAAIFLAIVKRTFKRAKSANSEECFLFSDNPLVTEVNGLLADYLYTAASNLDPNVFIDIGFENHPAIVKNCHALLMKYIASKASKDLTEIIKGKPELVELLEYSTKIQNIDALTQKIIKANKALEFI